MPTAAVRLGTSHHAAAGGEACVAGSHVELVTRQGWWIPSEATAPSRAEGLEQSMVSPEHPNDSANVAWSCQGKHLPGSEHGPVSTYKKSAAHQEQQTGSGQGHLLQENGFS